MILLIAGTKREECAAAIQKFLAEEAVSVSKLQQGAARLKAAEYDAVVVDQSCIEADPATADSLWRLAGAAPVISVNFAISGVERIARDVRAALARRRHEELHAAKHAQAALRNELAGPVSGILLSSELALAHPAIPSTVADKLRSVHQLALEIKSRLGSPI